jgi:probable F420-dependent oxidoreductase
VTEAQTDGDRSPRVGLLLSGDGLSLDEVVDVGVRAEDAGFDSIWHVQIQREPFVPLTAIAARTKRIRLGTGVATWAFQPVLAALMSASLSEISGGRFALGLGTGPKDWNERFFGMTYDRPVDRMREYVETIRGVWTAHSGASFDHTGDFYDVRGFGRSIAQPQERIPIYLAAVQKRMIALAGGVADGVLFNVFTTPRYVTEYAQPILAEAAAAAGRSLADVEIGAVVTTAVSEDGAQAREWARRHLAFYAVIPYFDVMFRLHGFEQEAAAVRAAAVRDDVPGMLAAVTDAMVEAFAIAGTPDHCRARLATFTNMQFLALFPPSFQLGPDEIKANHEAILECFAAG